MAQMGNRWWLYVWLFWCCFNLLILFIYPTWIAPLFNNMIVQRDEAGGKTEGGIIIPDTAKEKPQEGQVMAVGAGKLEKGERVPLDVKVGDRILFFDQGRLLVEEPPEQFFDQQRNDRIRAFLGQIAH